MGDIKFLTNTDEIEMRELEDGNCLFNLSGERMILSYDAVYDLALRLAYFLQKVDSGEESTASQMH